MIRVNKHTLTKNEFMIVYLPGKWYRGRSSLRTILYDEIKTGLASPPAHSDVRSHTFFVSPFCDLRGH